MDYRLPLSVLLACVVTFGLFWAMQALISVRGKLSESTSPPSVDFVRLRKDTQPEVKKREKPQREKPEQPPAPPNLSTSKASLDPGEGIADIAPVIDPGEALGGGIGAAGGADRDVVPLVRINPEYPMRALQRGIEGWVTVEFTISRAGTVKDPVVVSAHPGRVFNRSALQAIRKWKYNPRIEDGTAVERPGVRVTLEFTMEN